MAAAGVVYLVAGCAGGSDGPSDVGALAAFPPPPPELGPTVVAEDFVGAEACRSCHSEQYAMWQTSTHGRAGGGPDPSVIIAPFDGTPMEFRDGRVIPRRRGDAFEFVVRQDGHAEQVVSVDGVIGGGHMLGGGTQGFVTRLEDGTLRFLAFDWSATEGVWFCNTGSRLDQGWVPITPTLAFADCGDWPPVRPLGTVERFANCQQCHGSQIDAALSETLAAYETRYTTLRINCESCHGPGREHVGRAQAGQAELDADLGLESLVGLSKDASLTVCFQCHALKDVIRPGYLPGESLERFFALKFPVLGDEPYTADSRVRTFAYQATHLSSACYLDGPMDCVSCHEPHGQGYWDTDRKPLPDPFADGQCLSCHASKADAPERHTFHPPDSEGARCVSCHMPYLQHPEVGPRIPFARSDHTISIPRPAFDAELGIQGACAGCHADRTIEDLERQAGEWWGEIRPHRSAVAGLLEAEADGPGERWTRLLHPDTRDPMAQFQGLARYLVEGPGPDDTTIPAGAVDRLRALARDPDADVRALALAGLHWTRGNEPSVRGELVAALEADDGRLRDRWRLALGFLGDHYRDGGNSAWAKAAYDKAQEVAPNDPAVLTALGLLHNQSGDYRSAQVAFQRSLELNPTQPLTWLNLGLARDGLGDPAGAVRAYQRTLEINPREALAHFNLGNAALRADDLEAAAAAYRQAVAADPGLAMGHFNLARTLIRLGRIDEALPHGRRAVEFRPDYDPARQMLADLERAAGGGGG